MITKNRVRLWTSIGLLLWLTTFLAASTGCRSASEASRIPPPPDPTAVPADLPIEVKKVRDIALTHIGQQYNVNLPKHDDAWTVEYDMLVDIAGAGAYRLSAGDCVVTISNPLTGLNASVYHVVLDDPAAGLYWEGDVDCRGQVLPNASPTAEDVSAVPGTINLVTTAGLHKTVGIEICTLDCATYTPRHTISSPERIAAIIDALDTDMPLRPHVPCPASYQLRFILSDGQHVNFGYACQMMTPTYLRGGQAFWKGKDALAPDAFNQLILPFIGPSELQSSDKV